jgi:hypothetical protein
MPACEPEPVQAPLRLPTDELREAPLFLVHLAKEGEGYGAIEQGNGTFFVEGFDIEDAAGRARKIAAYAKRLVKVTEAPVMEPPVFEDTAEEPGAADKPPR